jgi:glycosyltransferase involved in cell wall biosynthesis
MTFYPPVSVIISNYNGLLFIENCLKSVLNSDYPTFEVIMVDDGSTDDSPEVVEKKF